ncbi:MAG: hypothetical protein AAF999_11055 [Pseudomonadota bacterium]
MAPRTDIVLILGSGPNATEATDWPRAWVDRVVAINNAWRVRPDWDDLIFPEDFPEDRRPERIGPRQRLIEADQFVPTQNACGGFVYAGGTMAFTAAYWVLQALRPKVIAFMGCDMVYPKSGNTHFYGTGAADPLRPDITLQDLGAKSARLGLIAARARCTCVNLSGSESALLFPRCDPAALRGVSAEALPDTLVDEMLHREEALGYFVPSGRYWEQESRFDAEALAKLDAGWRAAWGARRPSGCAA